MGQRQLPWSKTCFVCGESNPVGLGARFVERDGAVVLETVIDECFEGYPGHVHGGVITALLDETSVWAATLANRRFCVTKQITVSFIRPVPGGVLIRVRGELIERGDDQIKAKATVIDQEGAVLARAAGVFIPVSSEAHERLVSRLNMPGRSAELADV
jgi:uncharacterized protein (TIGR00369 family)